MFSRNIISSFVTILYILRRRGKNCKESVIYKEKLCSDMKPSNLRLYEEVNDILPTLIFYLVFWFSDCDNESFIK